MSDTEWLIVFACFTVSLGVFLFGLLCGVAARMSHHRRHFANDSMTRLYRLLRAALLAAETNPIVQFAVIGALVYAVVAQWR